MQYKVNQKDQNHYIFNYKIYLKVWKRFCTFPVQKHIDDINNFVKISYQLTDIFGITSAVFTDIPLFGTGRL